MIFRVLACVLAFLFWIGAIISGIAGHYTQGIYDILMAFGFYKIESVQ